MSVKVQRVYKNYGEFPALKGIDFTLNKGEVVGFLGPNGAGKTTLMKILTGVIRDFDGEVSVGGISVKQHPLEVKKRIGYLSEHNPLYPEMYVREFLHFIRRLHHSPAIRVEEVIFQTGLESHAGKIIKELSKGYRQRLGIAAALLHDPEVLILDEPTTGLDPNQLVDIRKIIKESGKEKTVLFSTHILQEAEAVSDRIIILNKGNKIADSHVGALQNSGELRLRVRFHKSPGLVDVSSLPGFIRSDLLEDETWELYFKSEEYVPTSIFDWAVNHNLKITALEVGHSDLEVIFREMTSTL